MDNGLDSAYPPTLSQARLARSYGYTWWGFYLPRLQNTDPLRGWSVSDKIVLDQAGITALPICVPSPPRPADPVRLAVDYFNLCKTYGIVPRESILYNGSHIGADGPTWNPIPGPKPTSVRERSAIQWGGGNMAGLSVDYNVSDPGFPAGTAIVCDLEYNVTYTTAWYQTFQNTIHQLGASGMASPTAKCVDFVKHPNGGYYLVGADGGVFTYNGAPFYGSTGAVKLNAPVNKMVLTDSGKGYWLIADDYGIFAFGDAPVLAHP